MLELKKITRELSAIPDPEIPVISIKDLGVLRDVSYKGNELVVTITPTYSAAPLWIGSNLILKTSLKK